MEGIFVVELKSCPRTERLGLKIRRDWRAVLVNSHNESHYDLWYLQQQLQSTNTIRKSKGKNFQFRKEIFFPFFLFLFFRKLKKQKQKYCKALMRKKNVFEFQVYLCPSLSLSLYFFIHYILTSITPQQYILYYI